MNSPAPSAPAAAPAVSPSRRRPALLVLTGALLLAGLGVAAWWALFARGIESTDNAYVAAPVVQVTPQVAGTVLAVLVDDTDLVRAGQPLVRLDPADARLALERAEAQLAQTVREVRQLYAQNATLASAIRVREAEVARAQADAVRTQAELARLQDDAERRRPLLASGAVTAEELQHADAAVVAARSALEAARSALAAAQSARAAAQDQAAAQRVLTEGTVLERHPAVERAAAALREALLALRRTELPAPVAGQVARRSVQVGQRIAPGMPLMSLVPLEQAWVEANFKESQLRRMRIGQRVTLHADLYGRDVTYEGRVAGLGAGTGAAFALLPAQNATGNWIKVVQRVPVRVELDPRQLAAHPLRVGLSMHASVEVGAGDGAPVAAAAPASPPRASSRTEAFADVDAEATQRVRRVIAAQLGRAVP